MGALDSFVSEMRGIFGDRLRSMVVYEAVVPTASSSKSPEPVHTLTLVDQVRFADLSACAARSITWESRGLATPLVMSGDEFVRSLDAFPLEYGHILASHRTIAGSNPFEGLSVNREDVRRACEVQAKSHLIHLREAYIEAAARPTPVARLIVASVGPFRALLASVARLRGNAADNVASLVQVADAIGLPAAVVERILGLKTMRDLPARDALSLFPPYLDAVERLAQHVDEWNR